MKNTVQVIAPMHPGEMIKEDWLADYELTQYALAKALKIPHSRLTDIIKGRRGISADTAVRLARFYGNTPEFWLNLQAHYDLHTVDAQKIEQEVAPLVAA